MTETSTWVLAGWDPQIVALILAWRRPKIFRPSFNTEIAKRVNDPEALERRARKPLKGGEVKPGETRLNHRVNSVIGHFVHAGLVSRTRDTITIIDRAGIQAVLAAGQVTYPRRGSSEDH